MPAAQPRTAQTTGTWVVQRSGISRWACAGRRRWMLPTRGFPPSWLRATMSKPAQKCSPSLASRMARTDSSRPARSTASMSAYIIGSSIALRLSGRDSRSVSTPESSATSRPGADS